jgi:mannose-6-phosphate isomerase-like protein (cupin superfamily)
VGNQSSMAKTGDRFELPDGSTYEVTKSTAETDGERVEMDFTLPAGSYAPPAHVHHGLIEEYEVIEGDFDVMVDGDWRTLGPGKSAAVPEGALHTFKNRSGETVRVHNVHRPAARFEDYIEHAHELMRARGIKSGKDPRVPIYLSMLMLEYPETLAPGRARERVMLKSLAGLGRLLRFKTDV